jgi:hypothetical protein
LANSFKRFSFKRFAWDPNDSFGRDEGLLFERNDSHEHFIEFHWDEKPLASHSLSAFRLSVKTPLIDQTLLRLHPGLEAFSDEVSSKNAG